MVDWCLKLGFVACCRGLGVFEEGGEVMAKFWQVAGIRQNIPASCRNPAKAVSPTEAVEVVIEVFLFVLRCFINRKVCRFIIGNLSK